MDTWLLTLLFCTSSLFSSDGGDHPNFFTIRNDSDKNIVVYQAEKNHILGIAWIPSMTIEPQQEKTVQDAIYGLKVKIKDTEQDFSIPANSSCRIFRICYNQTAPKQLIIATISH